MTFVILGQLRQLRCAVSELAWAHGGPVLSPLTILAQNYVFAARESCIVRCSNCSGFPTQCQNTPYMG
jgi:hypothetical protein